MERAKKDIDAWKEQTNAIKSKLENTEELEVKAADKLLNSKKFLMGQKIRFFFN